MINQQWNPAMGDYIFGKNDNVQNIEIELKKGKITSYTLMAVASPSVTVFLLVMLRIASGI